MGNVIAKNVTKGDEVSMFSKGLIRHMAREGKRQQDLIDDLGFQSGTVSSWVNGKHLPKNTSVERLADYLNTTPYNLYHNELPPAGDRGKAVITGESTHQTYRFNLVSARVRAGIRQKDAAARIGVSRQTLLSWEKGYTEPSASQIQIILETYGLPFEAMVFPKPKQRG